MTKKIVTVKKMWTAKNLKTLIKSVFHSEISGGKT